MTAARVWHDPGVIIERVPEYFRLRDANPFTRRPYAVALDRDLPTFISHAIERSLGIKPRRWNELVRENRVVEELDVDQAISLRQFLNSVSTRPDPPAGSLRGYCEDCWGTCAQRDTDGSLTGQKNAVVLCGCTAGMLRKRPTTFNPSMTMSCHERGWL